jgi:hypothetical protein
MDLNGFIKRIAFEPNTGCWIWIGEINPQGYGILHPKCSHGFKRAHRFSYYIHNGSFDLSKMVCHHCDNPMCVNPDHLYLGDAKQNAKDRESRKRTNYRNGSRHHNSKLNESIVVSIRNEFSKRKCTLVHLSKKYGVSESTIERIVHYKLWKHI